MFLKMPSRNSAVTTDNSTALRRSPRFLHQNNLPEPQGPKTPKPQSRNNRSRYLDHPLSSKPNVSVKRTRKDSAGNITVKLGQSNSCVSSSTGLRKSPRLQSGVEGFSNPDASLKKIHKGCTEKVGKDLRKPSAELQKCVSFSTGPRKSARLRGGVEGCSSPYASLQKTHKNCVENIGKELKQSSDELNKCVKSVTGPRKSSRLSKGVRESPRYPYQENAGEHVEMMHLKDGLRKSARLDNEFEVFQGFRRSPRFPSQGDNNNCVDRTVDGKCNRLSNSVLIESSKEDALVAVSKEEMGKRETRLSSSYVASPATALAGRDSKRKDINIGSTEIEGSRKRKLGEEGDIGLLSGWTKEQELALQRAYFAVNPTPHFWKKVAKLVPGKSAQDCFDKVHSDHLTPPPHRPRSRATRSNSSSQVSVPLSASKILRPAEPKIKRPGCSKKKTHRTQKAMRDLLQKHYEVDQDYEADLFSVLEPTATPSTQTSQHSVMLSTPEHVQGKLTFLQKLRERSSSDHKKPRSRFSTSFGSALVSSPVLKPVKNRALHEKYIDQLHSREARRKMASVQAAKSTLGEEDRKENHVQKMNAITAARNALVCDARDAINQFQYLQANPLSNSCEFDGDGVNVDEDDEGEDGT